MHTTNQSNPTIPAVGTADKRILQLNWPKELREHDKNFHILPFGLKCYAPL